MKISSPNAGECAHSLFAYLAGNRWLLFILLALLAEFIFFASNYPLVGSIDEISETIDGIAVKSYLRDALSGNVSNPITYFEDLQSHTFGLALKTRPLYFRGAEAALFFLLPSGIESARLLALLHAAAFFCAWYYFVSKDFGKNAAIASSLLLLADLNFMQYSWRIYLEFAYFLFALLAMRAFSNYLGKRSDANALALFSLVFLGLMTKEVFVAIFPAFAFLVLFRQASPGRSVQGLKLQIQSLFENRLFIPLCALTAILTVPWYLIKISTPLAASLAVGQPLTAQSLLLTYPLMLLSNEPILAMGLFAFLASTFISKEWRKPEFLEKYAPYLSVFLGFFILVSLASNKELRYLFFAYPIFSLFTAKFLESRIQDMKLFSSVVGAIVFLQIIISVNSMGSIQQMPLDDWKNVAAYVESEGGRYLFVANPSDSALSYFLLLDGDWRGNQITRLYSTEFAPVKAKYGVQNTSSPEFFYRMLDYYSINRLVVYSNSTATPAQATAAGEISKSSMFVLDKKIGAIEIYRVNRG